MERLANVIHQFAFEGEYLDAEVCTFGHINDTFVLRFQQPENKMGRYILQYINKHVFEEPAEVMANIQAVTSHLRSRIEEAGGDPERETINLVPTQDGKPYYVSPEGDYWRAYYFIEGARTYQSVENPKHFYHAGRAFGQFQKLLSDFPAHSLYETIEQFHDTRKRYSDFLEAVEADRHNRAGDVQREIEFVKARKADTGVIVDLIAAGEIPVRVTHNDTKLDNIMIDDATGEGICVIDLDTVMPGSALYDFGDSIRFGASSAPEDEPDLSKVWLDMELFAEFTKGYLGIAREFLTDTEVDHLAFSAKLLTLECGMRFLTDHLNGDEYFRIHRPNHNLDRARTQFKLVADMEGKMEQLEAMVRAALEE